MAKARVSLTLILSLVVLLGFAIIVQQYGSYLKQRDNLMQSDSQNRQLLQKLDEVLPQQEAFSEQLAEVSERYASLREQLPAELQLESFKDGFEQLLAARGLEVLAQREARYNRPLYHEVRLAYSVKGSVKSVQQVLSQLKKEPRLVLSEGPEKESDKNTGLVLSIYSVPAEEEPVFEMPQCLDSPQGIWFPLLKEELELLYSDYERTCHTLKENSALHQDIQRYRHLSESVLFLENILDTLTRAK